jgi:D-alanine-D-alanine ligase
MASLGPTGSYVYAAGKAGYNYTMLVNKILDVAAVRYFSENLSLPIDIDKLAEEKLPIPVRIRMFLRNKNEDTEKMLKKMVNINSYVRNVEGVNELGHMILKQLSGLNFSYHAYTQVEIGNILLLSNTHENDFDVLFISHLDNSTPFKKHVYFHEKGNKLCGTGIWDSKGGIAVMIAALRALRFVRALRTLKIGILLTTDDSLQGKISHDIIEEISSPAKVVFGLYGASLEGTVVTSRSGAAIYDCQMNLINPTKEIDVARANSKFTKLLNNFSKLSKEEDNVIVSPRRVNIDSNISNLFAQGQASISVRYNWPEQVEDYNRKIHELVKKKRSDKVQILLTGAGRRPPMVKNEEIKHMYEKVKTIADKIDVRVLEEHRWSSSNMCFVDIHKPKIDGLGPIGSSSQENEEYILRHSLLDRAVLLALLLNELRKRG